MSIVTSCGEVTKHVIIDSFSSYIKNEDKITCAFHLTLDDFRSDWKLVIYPMHPSNESDTSSVHCDVKAELTCLAASSPQLYTKQIKISSVIKGRENYPKQFHLVESNLPAWECSVISRITLESLKVVKDNKFEFYIVFQVMEDTFCKSEDGKISVIKDLAAILEEPKYFDTYLVSTSGSKMFAHSSVLHARSNIMKSAKILSLSSIHQCHEESNSSDIGESAEESTESSEHNKFSANHNPEHSSSSSGSSQNIPLFSFNGTLHKCSKPLFSVDTDNFQKSSSNIVVNTSPVKHNSTRIGSPSPSTTRKKINSSVTPKKRWHEKIGSPVNLSSQAQVTQYFPRLSSVNTKNDPFVDFSRFPGVSPVKLEADCLGSPSNKNVGHYSPHIKSDIKENNTPKKLSHHRSPLSVNTDIRSPCGTIPRKNMQNLKRKLFEGPVEENRNISILRLNMSTSVLQELLCWIYTGKSSRLHELSKPLLVAAKRHNIEDLSRAAQNHLISTLTVENVSEMLAMSHRYQADILKEESMKFAVSHASSVTFTASWGDLCLRYPEILIVFTKKLAAIKT